LDTLRDIHDTTGVPVILVGMDGIERKLVRHPQFARRITQRVVFTPCDIDDTQLVVRELCEVEVAPDLVTKIHTHTKGSIGLIAVALSQIESFAKGYQWKSISVDQWGPRPLFLGDKAVSR